MFGKSTLDSRTGLAGSERSKMSRPCPAPLRDLRKACRRDHIRRHRHTARPLSGIRHLPATDAACVIRMKKLIYKQSGIAFQTRKRNHQACRAPAAKNQHDPSRARCTERYESLHHHRSRKSNELHPHRPCRTISSHHTHHTNDAQSDRHPTTTETSNAVGLLAN